MFDDVSRIHGKSSKHTHAFCVFPTVVLCRGSWFIMCRRKQEELFPCPTSQHQPAAASTTQSKASLGLLLPFIFLSVMQFIPFLDDGVMVCVCVCHAEPLPEFSLEVNPLSKSFKVQVDVADYPVYVRWCYSNGQVCRGNDSVPVQTISPLSQPDVLFFPFLLPCVCVEVEFHFWRISHQPGCGILLSGVSSSFPGLLHLQ